MLLSNTFISLIFGTVAYQSAADDLRDAGKIAGVERKGKMQRIDKTGRVIWREVE